MAAELPTKQQETPMKCPTCNGKMRPGSASIHRSDLGMLADVALFDRVGAQTQYLYFQANGMNEAVYVDHTANAFGCPKCGTLVIAQKADKATDGPEDAIECMSCGKTIPPGATKCASCGWSWDEPAT
jgi:predicted RNA-binding Zn-ribbon protein involved in translation (DUF1610 family)